MTSPECLWSFLNEGEVSAMEEALRAALVSVLQLFKELHEKRCRRYQLKLDEAERQKAALTFQLKEAEQQLETLRQTACREQTAFEVSLCTSLSQTDGDGARATCRENGSAALKPEPLHETACFIKSEVMTPEEDRDVDFACPLIEHVSINQQTELVQTSWNGHEPQNEQDPAVDIRERKRMLILEKTRRYRERIRADPQKYHAWKEKNRLSYQRKKKSIHDLSEPMKKQKRMAWREASRRHRARKIAQATQPTQGQYSVH